MLSEERRAICVKALSIKSSKFTDWEQGFLHAVVFNSSSVNEAFYQKLKRLIGENNAQ